MSTYLSREDLVLKLSPYGVKSISCVNRLVREQGLPAKYLTPRKPFFIESEVDSWLVRRFLSHARANAKHAKFTAAEKARRNKEKKAQLANNALSAPISSVTPSDRGLANAPIASIAPGDGALNASITPSPEGRAQKAPKM
jgi:hypothetical protein